MMGIDNYMYPHIYYGASYMELNSDHVSQGCLLSYFLLQSGEAQPHVLPTLAVLSNYHNYSWRTGQLIYEA